MKNSELIKRLEELDPDAEIICGTHNGKVDTYGVVDYVFCDSYEETIYNDLFGTPFGTPGSIDERLMAKDIMDKNIIFIGSYFPIKHAYEFNTDNK